MSTSLRPLLTTALVLDSVTGTPDGIATSAPTAVLRLRLLEVLLELLALLVDVTVELFSTLAGVALAVLELFLTSLLEHAVVSLAVELVAVGPWLATGGVPAEDEAEIAEVGWALDMCSVDL